MASDFLENENFPFIPTIIKYSTVNSRVYKQMQYMNVVGFTCTVTVNNFVYFYLHLCPFFLWPIILPSVLVCCAELPVPPPVHPVLHPALHRHQAGGSLRRQILLPGGEYMGLILLLI